MTIAAGTIFLTGLATFASPCVLPMIPIYLSVLTGGAVTAAEAKGWGRLRLLANALAFVLGFTVVFVALGLTATAMGRFLLEHRLLFQQLGGLVVFLFGLKFMGWLHVAALEREKRFHLAPSGGMSPPTAFVMGLTFAFGWTPCVGPILGGVLMYTSVSTSSMWEGAANLALYSAGIALPLLAIALLAQPGLRFLNRIKRHIPRIEKVTGVVLMAVAVLMITDSTTLLSFGLGEDSAAGLSVEMVSEAQPAADEPLELASAVTEPVFGAAAAAETCGAETSACGFEPDAADLASAEGAFGGVSAPPGAGDARATVLYFYSPNCPACMKMAPLIEAMKRTCSGRGLDLVKINLATRENRARAARSGVRGTPTIVFLDPAGAEVARLIGAVDFDTLHGATAAVMGEACADFSPL